MYARQDPLQSRKGSPATDRLSPTRDFARPLDKVSRDTISSFGYDGGARHGILIPHEMSSAFAPRIGLSVPSGSEETLEEIRFPSQYVREEGDVQRRKLAPSPLEVHGSVC